MCGGGVHLCVCTLVPTRRRERTMAEEAGACCSCCVGDVRKWYWRCQFRPRPRVSLLNGQVNNPQASSHSQHIASTLAVRGCARVLFWSFESVSAHAYHAFIACLSHASQDRQLCPLDRRPSVSRLLSGHELTSLTGV